MKRLLMCSGNSSRSSAVSWNSDHTLLTATFAYDGVIFRDVGEFVVTETCGNMNPPPRYASPNTCTYVKARPYVSPKKFIAHVLCSNTWTALSADVFARRNS